MKKCLRWINLLVVFRDKCNNGIKKENSTGSLSIINRVYLIYIVGSKQEGMPFSGMINLNLNMLKVCRIKSINRCHVLAGKGV